MDYAKLGETWGAAWKIGNTNATRSEMRRAATQAAQKLKGVTPEQFGKFYAGWLQGLARGTQKGQ